MRSTEDLLRRIIAEAAALETLNEAPPGERPTLSYTRGEDETPEEASARRQRAISAANPAIAASAAASVVPTVMPEGPAVIRRAARGSKVASERTQFTGLSPTVGGESYTHLAKTSPLAGARQDLVDLFSSVEDEHKRTASAMLASDSATIPKRAVCELVLTRDVGDEIKKLYGEPTYDTVSRDASQGGSIDRAAATKLYRMLKMGSEEVARARSRDQAGVIKKNVDLIKSTFDASDDTRAVLETLALAVKNVLPVNGLTLNLNALLGLRLSVHGLAMKSIVKKMDETRRNVRNLERARGVTEPGSERIETEKASVFRMPKALLPKAREPNEATDEEIEALEAMSETRFEHQRALGLYLVACAATVLNMRPQIEEKIRATPRPDLPDYLKATGDTRIEDRVLPVLDALEESLSKHSYSQLAIEDKPLSAFYAAEAQEREDSERATIRLGDSEVDALEYMLSRLSQAKLQDSSEASAISSLLEAATSDTTSLRATKLQLDAALLVISRIVQRKYGPPASLEQTSKLSRLKTVIQGAISSHADASSFEIAPETGASRVPEKSGVQGAEVLAKDAVPSLEIQNEKLKRALGLAINVRPSEEDLTDFEGLIKRVGTANQRQRAFEKTARDTFKASSPGRFVARALGLNENDEDPVRAFLNEQHSELAAIVDAANKTRKKASEIGHAIKAEISGAKPRQEYMDALKVSFRAALGEEIELARQERPDLTKEIYRRIRSAQDASNETTPQNIFLTQRNLLLGATQLALDVKGRASFSVTPYAFPFMTVTGKAAIDPGESRSRREHQERLVAQYSKADPYIKALGSALKIGAEVVVPSMMSTRPGMLSLGVCQVVGLETMSVLLSDDVINRVKAQDPDLGKALAEESVRSMSVNVVGVVIRCPPSSWRVGSTAFKSDARSSLAANLRVALRGLDSVMYDTCVGLDEDTGELILRCIAPAFLSGRISDWSTQLSKYNWPSALTNVAFADISTQDAMRIRERTDRESGKSYIPASAVQVTPRDLLHPSSPFNVNQQQIQYTIGAEGSRGFSVATLPPPRNITPNERAIRERAEEHARRLQALMVEEVEDDQGRKRQVPLATVQAYVPKDGLPAIRVLVTREQAGKLPSVAAAIDSYEQLSEDFEPVGDRVDGNGTTVITYQPTQRASDPSRNIESYDVSGQTISVGNTVYILLMYPGRMLGASFDGKFPREIYGVGKVVRIYMRSGDTVGGSPNEFDTSALLVDVEFRGDQVKRAGTRGSIFSPPVTLRGVGGAFLRNLRLPLMDVVTTYDPSQPRKPLLSDNYRLLDGTVLQGAGWDRPSDEDVRLAGTRPQSVKGAVIGATFRVKAPGPSLGEVGKLSGFVTRSQVPSEISRIVGPQDVNAILDASGGEVLSQINSRIRDLQLSVVGTHSSSTDARQLFRHIDRDVAIRFAESAGSSDLEHMPVPRSLESSLGTLYGCRTIARALIEHGPEKDTPTHVSAESERRRRTPGEVSDVYIRNDRMLGAPYDKGSHTLEARYKFDDQGMSPSSPVGTTFRLQIPGETGLAYTRMLSREMGVVEGKFAAAIKDIKEMIEESRMPDSSNSMKSAAAALADLQKVLAEITEGRRIVDSLHVFVQASKKKNEEGEEVEEEEVISNTLDAWREKSEMIDSLQQRREVSFDNVDFGAKSWSNQLKELNSRILAVHSELLGSAPIPTRHAVDITDDGVIRITLTDAQPVSDASARRKWVSAQRSIIDRIEQIVSRSSIPVTKGADGEVSPAPVKIAQDLGKGRGVRALISGMRARFDAHREASGGSVLAWETDIMAHPPLGEVISSEEVRDAIMEEPSSASTAPGLETTSKRRVLASQHPDSLGRVEIVLSEEFKKAVEEYTVKVAEFVNEGNLAAMISPIVYHLTPPQKRGMFVGDEASSAALEQLNKEIELAMEKKDIAAVRELEREKIRQQISLLSAKIETNERLVKTTDEGVSGTISQHIKTYKDAKARLEQVLASSAYSPTGLTGDQREVLSKVVERLRSYESKFIADVRRNAFSHSSSRVPVPDAAARAAADLAHALTTGLGNIAALSSTGRLTVRDASPEQREKLSALKKFINTMPSERGRLATMKQFPSETGVERIVSTLNTIEEKTTSFDARRLCVPIANAPGTSALLNLKQGQKIPEDLLPSVLAVIEPTRS